MNINGSPRLYGKAAIPLTKSIEDIYIAVDIYPFVLLHVFVSWIRNPASTPDLNITFGNPSDQLIDEWQNVPIPIENITSPAAFGFVDFAETIDMEFEPETNIHLVISGQDPNDPPVINITCYGIQPFTKQQVKYDI